MQNTYYFIYKDATSDNPFKDHYITLKIQASDKYEAYNKALSLISDDIDLSECFEISLNGISQFLPVNTFLEDKNLK